MKQGLRILFLALFTLPLLFITSCSKDDESSGSYYVNYEVLHGIKKYNLNKTSLRTIKYKTENGTSSLQTTGEWEGTFGPFKKGATVWLNVQTTGGTITTSARLSVSKDGAPFVVKKESLNTMSTNLNYTIK